MKNLLHLFLERGMKITDLFWIGGGAILIFIFAIFVGRYLHWLDEHQRDNIDPWNDEPWR